jgi:hypothetical protein
MSIHLLLDIVPEALSADDWADAYDTTARLLALHPSGLLGYDWMMVFGVRLPAYARTIERYADTPAKRHLGVIGDRQSLLTGDCLTLYRDLRHYRRGGTPRLPVHGDILQFAAEERRGDTSGPAQVFGGRTHGAPYHVPLLAAAMVIESRFPLSAMVWGDLTRAQAEEAQRFAEGALGVPVPLPVRMDGSRLAERLRRFLSGEKLVAAFDELCLDRAARGLAAWGAPGSPRRSRSPAPSSPAPEKDLCTVTSLADLSPERRDDIHALALGVRRLQERARAGAASATAGLAAVIGCGHAPTLRRAIAQLLSERGPTLTEDAWDRIAAETDLAALEFLAALASLQTGSLAFFQAQRAVFENELVRSLAVAAAR